MNHDQAWAEMARAERHRRAGDPHRARYHFQPPANWMNDPNGLIQWGDQYHLFYQYNPKGPWHERIHWGHAVSTDLVHWRDLPVALAPTDGGPDDGGCWSGCAVDLGDCVRLFYTGVRPQVVCTATSRDPELRTWQKHPAALLDAPPPGIDAGDPADFRDPFVWRQDDGWMMVMGSRRVNGGGIALLYRSGDLLNWTYLHTLLEGDPARREPFWPGTMWECPNFFYLNGTPVLIVSIEDKQGSDLRFPAYYAGTLQDWRLIPQTQDKLDHGGSFYAPLTMVDDRGRVLMWGWLQENRSREDVRAAGWSGIMSLPRELFLHNDGSVGQRPVAELGTLRGAHWQQTDLTSDAMVNSLAEITGTSLELHLRWRPSAEGALDLGVRCSPDGAEEMLIRYDAPSQTLSVDRTRASLSTNVDRDVRAAQLPLHGGLLDLRVFLDGSTVEIFANERVCFASRVYPTRADSTGLRLSTSGGTLHSLDVWEIQSIW